MEVLSKEEQWGKLIPFIKIYEDWSRPNGRLFFETLVALSYHDSTRLIFLKLLLLNNETLKKEVLGVFIKSIYDDLKKDKSWVNHYCEEMRLKIFLKWES